MILSSLLSAASFSVVAMAQLEWQAIVGIIFMSLSAALGDITTLAYLTKFNDRYNFNRLFMQQFHVFVNATVSCFLYIYVEQEKYISSVQHWYRCFRYIFMLNLMIEM